MKCKLIPLDDRIVIRRSDADAQSKGGILIPDSAQKKSRRGTVVAVGPGGRVEGDVNGRRSPPVVEPGCKVAFAEYAGSEVEVDGEVLVVLRESDIIAIVRG